jgi:hypothetical protein
VPTSGNKEIPVPDPIPSSNLPNSLEPLCAYGRDPSTQTCQMPTSAPPAPSSANSCEVLAGSADAAASSGAAGLVQKFSGTNHSALLASSASPAAPPPTIAPPSGPPVLTVRPDQIDVQTGIPQFVNYGAIGNLHVTAKGDLLNAGAHIGSLNEDGSRGENEGIGANLVNEEVTLDYSGWSFSLGVGVSLGGSIASGEGRDLDKDGVPERCFKMTLGPLTLGECDEL